MVGEPNREEPLGRPRRRWEDNIRMDLQEVELGADSEFRQVAGSCECGNKHSGPMKCREFFFL